MCRLEVADLLDLVMTSVLFPAVETTYQMCLQLATSYHVCVRPDVSATCLSSVGAMMAVRSVLRPTMAVTSVTAVVIFLVFSVVSVFPVAMMLPSSLFRFLIDAGSVGTTRQCPGDCVLREAVLPVIATRPLERFVVRYVFTHFSICLLTELSQTSNS